MPCATASIASTGERYQGEVAEKRSRQDGSSSRPALARGGGPQGRHSPGARPLLSVSCPLENHVWSHNDASVAHVQGTRTRGSRVVRGRPCMSVLFHGRHHWLWCLIWWGHYILWILRLSSLAQTGNSRRIETVHLGEPPKKNAPREAGRFGTTDSKEVRQPRTRWTWTSCPAVRTVEAPASCPSWQTRKYRPRCPLS
jgi:hypothetical protein